MVGVPRSRACLNCRRSRVKCDETKPACERCTSRGKTCEGYPRTSTFVHRQADGTEVRERVEEAAPPKESNIGSDNAASFYPSPQTAAGSPREEASASLHDEDPKTLSSLISRFLDMWLPTEPSNRVGPTIYWLTEVAHIANPEPALQAALHALAVDRVASVNDDSFLKEEGQRSYGKALALLSSQLSTADSISDDEALSAARILMIYEFYASTSNSVKGWNAHQHGVFNLATSRGPDSFDTPFREALLLDIKNVNFILTVQHRSRSRFLDDQWRCDGDLNSLSAIEHKLYELGFQLSVSLGEIELVLYSANSSSGSRKDLFVRFAELATGFQRLMTALNKLRPAHTSFASADFWDLASAVLAAYILTLYFRVCGHLRDGIGMLLQNPMIEETERWQLESLAPKYSLEKVVALAERAYSAIEYATGDNMGLYGGQKLLFPMRVFINKLPTEIPQLGKMLQLYKSVILSKGLTHAVDLDNLWGMYEEKATEYGPNRQAPEPT